MHQEHTKGASQSDRGRLSLGRCVAGFVRPSGTEDVVRIYAEARTEVRARAMPHFAAWIARRTGNPNHSSR